LRAGRGGADGSDRYPALQAAIYKSISLRGLYQELENWRIIFKVSLTACDGWVLLWLNQIGKDWEDIFLIAARARSRGSCKLYPGTAVMSSGRLVAVL